MCLCSYIQECTSCPRFEINFAYKWAILHQCTCLWHWSQILKSCFFTLTIFCLWIYTYMGNGFIFLHLYFRDQPLLQTQDPALHMEVPFTYIQKLRVQGVRETYFCWNRLGCLAVNILNLGFHSFIRSLSKRKPCKIQFFVHKQGWPILMLFGGLEGIWTNISNKLYFLSEIQMEVAYGATCISHFGLKSP